MKSEAPSSRDHSFAAAPPGCAHAQTAATSTDLPQSTTAGSPWLTVRQVQRASGTRTLSGASLPAARPARPCSTTAPGAPA